MEPNIKSKILIDIKSLIFNTNAIMSSSTYNSSYSFRNYPFFIWLFGTTFLLLRAKFLLFFYYRLYLARLIQFSIIILINRILIFRLAITEFKFNLILLTHWNFIIKNRIVIYFFCLGWIQPWSIFIFKFRSFFGWFFNLLGFFFSLTLLLCWLI